MDDKFAASILNRRLLQGFKTAVYGRSNDIMSDENDSEDSGKMPVRGLAIWLMILAMVVLVYALVANTTDVAKPITLNEFRSHIADGTIEKANAVEKRGNIIINGKMADEGGDVAFQVKELKTDDLIKELQNNDAVTGPVLAETFMQDFLIGLVPILIVLGLLYFLFMRQMRSAGKGAMSFGKSRAKMLTRNKNKVTFKDVAGVEEASEEMQEIIDFLRDPKKFQRLGGSIPKGVLLVGPPGTGKTLLAKAISGEADVPFFSISGSDFVEMFVGVGASRVRDMFEQGRKNAPCIIFIDEIDAVGRSRFSGIGGGHDEREQTLNALLVEMDGFDTQEGIIIIAATNRPDVLDNALLRPGRFDRQIHVDLPGLEGRTKILKIHGKKVKLAANVDLSKVARGTPGFSGADLANLINEGALLAARRNAKSVRQRDLEAARDKVAFGVERRSRIIDPKQQKVTAYHEAGHAIIMALQEHSEPVHKVTIIPRGQSLGSTMQLPEKDQYTQGKKQLEAMLVAYMGGRAAEEIVFDDITTGASSDIKQSTRIARAMVCQFGMDPEVGPQAFGENEEHLFLGREVSRSQSHSEKTAQLIDERVHLMLQGSYDKAMEMLTTNRRALDTMARILLEQETITGDDVDDIIRYDRIRPISERDPEKAAELERMAAAEAEEERLAKEKEEQGLFGDDSPPPYPPPDPSPA